MTPSIRRIFFSEVMIWIILGIVCMIAIWPLREKIRLGIDLVGGTYLTLEVDTKKALESDLIKKLQAVDSLLKKSSVKIMPTKMIVNDVLQLTFSDTNNLQTASTILKKAWKEEAQISAKENVLFVSHTTAMKDRLADDAVQRNIDVLRTRLDRFSVAEIPIYRQGQNRIEIELPDVEDPQKAKEMIGRTALLEFRLVYQVASSEDDLLFDLEGEIPYDRDILPGEPTKYGQQQYYLVEKYAQVNGKMLKTARPGLGGEMGMDPVVQFEFDGEGAEKFYEITSKNIGKQLAIVLDGQVISAPSINSAISGSGQISGDFKPEDVKTLALLLQSGSFVAPVSFVEERQIGPSLGEAAIKSGLFSCIAGFILLFIFSILFYKFSGFLAFLALIYNLILLLAGLSLLQATLTLPGIAGIILTIGMAIDSAILVFEQIRDEIQEGIASKIAIKKGFSDAMAVILDANITTFLVGVVLYNVGNGPVQGFAVTLMLGIVATLIASLMFLRSMFTFVIKNSKKETISI